MRPARRDDRRRGADLHKNDCRVVFVGRRDELSARPPGSGWSGRRRLTAANDRHDPLHRLQLRRARRDRGRGDRRGGGRSAIPATLTRGRHRRPPLLAPDARPRPGHPHLRREAALELPAVAVGLLGAVLLRRPLAGLRRGGLASEALAGLRRAASAASAPRRRRLLRSRLLVAVIGHPDRPGRRDPGGVLYAVGRAASWPCLACTSTTRLLRPYRPNLLVGYLAGLGVVAGAYFWGLTGLVAGAGRRARCYSSSGRSAGAWAHTWWAGWR